MFTCILPKNLCKIRNCLEWYLGLEADTIFNIEKLYKIEKSEEKTIQIYIHPERIFLYISVNNVPGKFSKFYFTKIRKKNENLL